MRRRLAPLLLIAAVLAPAAPAVADGVWELAFVDDLGIAARAAPEAPLHLDRTAAVTVGLRVLVVGPQGLGGGFRIGGSFDTRPGGAPAFLLVPFDLLLVHEIEATRDLRMSLALGPSFTWANAEISDPCVDPCSFVDTQLRRAVDGEDTWIVGGALALAVDVDVADHFLFMGMGTEVRVGGATRQSAAPAHWSAGLMLRLGFRTEL